MTFFEELNAVLIYLINIYMCRMALASMLSLVLPVPSLSAHVLVHSSNGYVFVNVTNRCFNIYYKYLYVSQGSSVHALPRPASSIPIAVMRHGDAKTR